MVWLLILAGIEELGEGLRSLYVGKLSGRELEELCRLADQNGDGQVAYEEFTRVRILPSKRHRGCTPYGHDCTA